MTRWIVKVSGILASQWTIISLLALIMSRALPGAGAIAFFSVHNGLADIYVFDMGQSTLHNLTNNGTAVGAFTFSPDGRHIAFESNRNGNTEIYMVAVQCPNLFVSCGQGMRQLTNHETDSRNPIWSPDGKQIAYVYDVAFEDSNNDIYVVDIESNTEHNLTNSMADDTMPAWSPDSRHIAFVSNRDGNYEIYMMNSDGSNPRPLTVNDNHDSNPVWSPDGNHIAFVSQPEGNEDIFIIHVDREELQRVTTSYGIETDPVWSPNGGQIAYRSNGRGVSDLYTIDVNSGQTHCLTQDMPLEPIRYAWSPDEQWIAFLSIYADYPGIYLMSAEGSGVRRLTYERYFTNIAWWP